jgi:hypothetical protein
MSRKHFHLFRDFNQHEINLLMKTKIVLILTMALVVLLGTAGCKRALVLKTPLEPSEKVSQNDTVLVDGKDAGHVEKVTDEGGQRMALLVIEDQTVATQKMRVGVVRVLDDGKMSLRTDETDAQSPLLTSGAIVPVMSKTGFAVRHLTSDKVLMFMLAGFAIIVLAMFCFRRLVQGGLLLLALVLSSCCAWLALPWASDVVNKIYNSLPQPNSTGSAGTAQIGSTQSAFWQFMHNPPSPEIVGYCSVFLLVFIILSVCVFGATKRFGNQN